MDQKGTIERPRTAARQQVEPKSIWNGVIRFGLVNVPVGLVVARQSEDVQFRLLHAECGSPIQQRQWCPIHERHLEASEVVRGFEFATGQFVKVDDVDLARANSTEIELDRFVRVDAIPELYLDRTWYLKPAKDAVSRKAYRLLVLTLWRTGMGGMGRFVFHGKEHVTLIRPIEEVLCLTTLYLADDVRPATPIVKATRELDDSITPGELDAAVRAIDSRATQFLPRTHCRSTQRNDLLRLLAAKVEAGVDVLTPDPTVAAPLDLKSALEASTKTERRRRGG
jgi:DNA end-binding protein Ku